MRKSVQGHFRDVSLSEAGVSVGREVIPLQGRHCLSVRKKLTGSSQGYRCRDRLRSYFTTVDVNIELGRGIAPE